MKLGRLVLMVTLMVLSLVVVGFANPTLTLDNTVVSTTGDIYIPGFFTSNGGHICTEGTADVGAGKTVKISGDLKPAWVFSAPEVTCNDFTTFGNLYSPNVTYGGSCKSLFSDPSALACPDDPQFPAFVSGGNDITCEKTGTDITPGTYGNLKIAKYGVCNFTTPGTYNFVSIVAGTSRWSVNFVQDPGYAKYTINVTEFLHLGEYGKWNIANVIPVFVNVEGTDGDYNNANRCPNNQNGEASAFCHRGDGTYKVCRTHVPNGTIAFRGNLAPIGQNLSSGFITVRGLGVHATMPDAALCFEAKPDCSCLNDVPAVAAQGDTITLKGKGFSPDTIDKVIFNAAPGNVNIAAPIGDCEAIPTIIDEYTLEVVVPACAPGDYYATSVNDVAMCSYRWNTINITP